MIRVNLYLFHSSIKQKPFWRSIRTVNEITEPDKKISLFLVISNIEKHNNPLLTLNCDYINICVFCKNKKCRTEMS